MVWYTRNKFYKKYRLLISKAKSRTRSVGYTEKHHIVPKFCGGSDDKLNLVRLTPRKHFIAHMLLVRCVRKQYRQKAIYALWMMARFTNVRGNKRYALKSSEFAKARRLKAEASKGFRGRDYWTEDSHNSWLKKMKRYWATHNAWNFGLKQSAEMRSITSQTTKEAMARPEVKAKMKGVPKSKSHRRALSTAAFNRPVRKCPHCGIQCQLNMYARWHGDKCREI